MSSVAMDWRSMRGLHAIEHGAVNVPQGQSCGLERETRRVAKESYGRSVEQIAADHREYAKAIDEARGLALQVVVPELVVSE